MKISINVEFTLRRCYSCSKYYYSEATTSFYTCPYCALRLRDEASERYAKLERRLLAQKSATTRTKRR